MIKKTKLIFRSICTLYLYLRPHKGNVHEDFVRGLGLLPDNGSTLDVAKTCVVLRKEAMDKVDPAST